MGRVSEIKVSYKNKIPSCETYKIQSAEEAALLLLDNWNSDTIELFESFKVMLLNNSNKVKGIYEYLQEELPEHWLILDCYLLLH